MFKVIEDIHFVGIGGAGMSGIAEVLLNLGYRVSGSDARETEVTRRLSGLGVRICLGHSEENVGKAQVVVVSTAITPENPEIRFAKSRKIPVIPRIEMLAEIARLKYTIAIAGTHGKTTTTSLVASVLQESGMDPTFVIGGRLNHLQSGARLGQGDFLVAEADESDGSFLKLSPTFALITNIDDDHLDYYKTMKNLRTAFTEFANRVPFYGCAIVCMEDPGVRSIFSRIQRRVITYGLDPSLDYSARDLRFEQERTRFTLLRGGNPLGEIELKISGRHNVLNSLGACACGMELQIPFEKIVSALGKFENAQRRLEKRGEKNGSVWIDDYGHHPTEIRATLDALKARYPNRKIVVIFQPHRFTRTRILLQEFGKCFRDADEIFLLPIYPAGEKKIPGVSSGQVLAILKKNGKKAALLEGGGFSLLEKNLAPGNVIVTLGAGDVWKTGEKLFSVQA